MDEGWCVAVGTKIGGFLTTRYIWKAESIEATLETDLEYLVVIAGHLMESVGSGDT
jgi:hypothetical protein